MTGYLQRLVSTAAGRGDAVHPRTGSIFSPRLEEPRAPLQDWETERVTAAQPRPRAHATPLDLDPPDAARDVRPRSEPSPLLPKSVAGESREPAPPPPFLPMLPDHAAGPVDVFDGRSEDPLEHSPSSQAGMHGAVTAALSGRAGEAFLPIVKASRVVSTAERRETSQQRHAAPGAQQPDEIQIHIGRIEVVAVPPPAPARAPKAPDRSLSLDAYLSRRDGGAK